MTDFKEFIQLAYEDSLDLKSTKSLKLIGFKP